MVATVLKLRYRILGNTLARRPWQLVGFCFGVLGALSTLGLVVAGIIALAVFQGLDVARTVAVLNVVQPPALALALITAPNRTPQVTVAEAQRLYDENGEPIPAEPV